MSSTDNSNMAYIQTFLSKPVIAGVVASLLDRYWLKIPDTKQNAIFGISVALGTAGGDYIGDFAPAILGDTQLYSGKVLSQRLTEITFGAGTGYVLNRFILKNDFTPSQMYQKLGVVVVSQVVSEYATDYFSNRTLSYLTM